MNANYIYRIYRTIDFVASIMNGHKYDYNCAMAMMQQVEPISPEEQKAMIHFMNDHMDRLIPAYHESYEALEKVVAEIVAEQEQEIV